MHKAAQTGLNAADYHRQLGPQLLRQLCIYRRGMVGPLAHLAAGRILIDGARIFRCCIMAQHGIKIAAANQHAQTGLAQSSKVFCLGPIGLAQQCNLVALCFQHTTNHCRSKRGMVHIGIATNEQKVQLLPATLCNFFSGNR